ncbi:hypothetical protein Y032_0237g3248 [Ancylostoma ceylanicum]|uniref:Uncharacterized protein n=2 Tax=Ancylostoma ceylanicum TaxID=53326 RepID=A0A016SFJ2_9BILA|nr:hypothetical protein Y032_0237g3248 [Ancylostoma ceylanicum]
MYMYDQPSAKERGANVNVVRCRNKLLLGYGNTSAIPSGAEYGLHVAVSPLLYPFSKRMRWIYSSFSELLAPIRSLVLTKLRTTFTFILRCAPLVTECPARISGEIEHPASPVQAFSFRLKAAPTEIFDSKISAFSGGIEFPRSRRHLNYTGNKHIESEAVLEKLEGLKVVREGDLIELRGSLPFETASKAN